MEHNESDGNHKQDTLSQSYSQGIEKISRIENKYVFDFHIPKEIIEEREKSWDSLFDKYSGEVSDEFEVNIDTLEPEVTDKEEQYSGQRVCMRKPLSVVQYWVDTGNLPYKSYLCDSDRSASGSSLSERESSSLQFDMGELGKYVDHKNDEEPSSTSVDTAVYILSNANVTKKADTMVIVEGAKSSDMTLPENNSDDMLQLLTISESEALNGRTDGTDNCNFTSCRDTGIDTEIINKVETENKIAAALNHNDWTKSILNNSFFATPEKEDANKVIKKINNNMASKNNNDSGTDSSDQADFISNPSTNKNLSSAENEGNNVHGKNVEVTPIKEASCKNDINPVDEICDQEMEAIYTSQKNFETSTCNSVKLIRRKKLFTNRNSPIDLISITNQCKNKISRPRLSEHPALDFGKPNEEDAKKALIKKRKKAFLARKRNKESKFRNSANTSIESNGGTTDSLHDYSMQSLISMCSKNSSFNNPRTKKKKVEKKSKQLSNASNVEKSVDLKLVKKIPVVRLERLSEDILCHLSKNKCDKSENLTAKIVDEKINGKYRKKRNESFIYPHEIQKVDMDTAESDQSTILICKCNHSESRLRSSLSSFYSPSDSSSKDIVPVEKTTEQMSDEAVKGLNAFANLMKQKLSPVVVLERLDTSPRNNAKSKQDLTVNSPQCDINKCDTSQTDIQGTQYDMSKKALVILEKLPEESFIKSPTLSQKKNMSQSASRIIKSNKEDTRYSFLHLPSSDEDTNFSKFIELFHSKRRKKRKPRDNVTAGEGNVSIPNNSVVKRNGNSSVSRIWKQTQARISTAPRYVVTSSDTSMSDVNKDKKPKRVRRVTRGSKETSVVKKKQLPSVKNYATRSSSKQEKTEKNVESTDESRGKRVSPRTSERLLKQNSCVQNGSSTGTPPEPRKQFFKSDSESEGFLDFANVGQNLGKNRKIVTSEKNSSPAKRSSPKSVKLSRKQLRSTIGRSKNSISRKTLTENSVRRNLTYSETSDSDASLLNIMKKEWKLRKRNSAGLLSDKSSAEIKDETRRRSNRKNNETPARRITSPRKSHERSTKNLFNFLETSDENEEMLFKKATVLPRKEAGYYLKVDSTVNATLTFMEGRNTESDVYTKDDKRSKTSKPLTFQTKALSESDSG